MGVNLVLLDFFLENKVMVTVVVVVPLIDVSGA